MEAFLFMLDVFSMIVLCLGVRRVIKTGVPENMGIFAYRAEKSETSKK